MGRADSQLVAGWKARRSARTFTRIQTRRHSGGPLGTLSEHGQRSRRRGLYSSRPALRSLRSRPGHRPGQCLVRPFERVALPSVNTTAGAIDVANLGFVLTHEHVLIASPDVRLVWPESFDHQAARGRAITRLSAARAAGGDTFVDVTTTDFGRDAQFVQAAATAAGLAVILFTGRWT